MNADSNMDVLLCEAVKIHMLAASLELYEHHVSNVSDLPVWASMLFLRDTSMNPHDFMLNHLNPVGDIAGLEQVKYSFCNSKN